MNISTRSIFQRQSVSPSPRRFVFTFSSTTAESTSTTPAYESALTLLASAVAPYLTDRVVTEMSAVGGVLLLGLSINLLGLGKERLKVANMLPAVFLPVGYLPLYDWISGLI